MFSWAVMRNMMVERTGLSVMAGGFYLQHKWLRGRSQQERTVSDLTGALRVPHSSVWSPQSSCSRLMSWLLIKWLLIVYVLVMLLTTDQRFSQSSGDHCRICRVVTANCTLTALMNKSTPTELCCSTSIRALYWQISADSA